MILLQQTCIGTERPLKETNKALTQIKQDKPERERERDRERNRTSKHFEMSINQMNFSA